MRGGKWGVIVCHNHETRRVSLLEERERHRRVEKAGPVVHFEEQSTAEGVKKFPQSIKGGVIRNQAAEVSPGKRSYSQDVIPPGGVILGLGTRS